MVIMHDLHPGVNLGKLPAKEDPRTIPLHKVFDTELPIPPDSGNRAARVGSWPMFLNDTLSDCGPAGIGHLLQCARFFTSRTFDITDDDVKAFYFDVTGGKDSGVFMLDMMKKWQQDGLKGDKVIAFLSVDLNNVDHVRLAINYLGGILVGLGLPNAARVMPTWDYLPGTPMNGVWAPYSWGGHCAYVPDYSGGGSVPLLVPCITWAMVKLMTISFLQAFGDEGYVVVTSDWLDASGHSPHGLDEDALKNELAAVGAPINL